MSQRAVVLGCGLVGATMARELAAQPSFVVTVADVSDPNLRKVSQRAKVRTIQADLSDPKAVLKIAKEHDLVLGALPSRFGLQTLEAVIRAGKPYCDISFMPEDALALSALAKEHKTTAVVDCGVSPGLSNVMVGYAAAHLDHVESAVIYVGGLPKVRRWPFDYKAPFAPSDVIEEYTRPARMVQNSRVVTKAALSDPELIDFPQVGTLEGFNTDGLRSLLTTVKADNMGEKTLRYPGHCEVMRMLRETGFFQQEEIEIRGTRVRPLDVTSRLLFPRWTYEPGEEEFTVLRVVVEGRRGKTRVRHSFDLYDEYDKAEQTSSMARTTGFPCVIVAMMLVRGRLAKPGVHPPEALALEDGLFSELMEELRRRGVMIQHATEEL
jgi:saccharopine dehydrogenase-like NADP-dependent oxidoreductase